MTSAVDWPRRPKVWDSKLPAEVATIVTPRLLVWHRSGSRRNTMAATGGVPELVCCVRTEFHVEPLQRPVRRSTLMHRRFRHERHFPLAPPDRNVDCPEGRRIGGKLLQVPERVRWLALQPQHHISLS